MVQSYFFPISNILFKKSLNIVIFLSIAPQQPPYTLQNKYKKIIVFSLFAVIIPYFLACFNAIAGFIATLSIFIFAFLLLFFKVHIYLARYHTVIKFSPPVGFFSKVCFKLSVRRNYISAPNGVFGKAFAQCFFYFNSCANV